MSDTAGYAELAAATDISESYAHEILSGARTPSRSLAIHILRKTGRRLPPIADMSDEAIALHEQLYPYQPKRKQAA